MSSHNRSLESGEATAYPATARKWLLLAVLCLAGGTIYTYPFLRFSYYDPLREALGLSHTQLGVLQASYGIVATLGYLPGGWLADRYSPRKLLTLSLLATGASGFFYSTFPSYFAAIALHAFWGLSAVVFFWTALIKATRNLGPRNEQGRLFGFLEGGRGIVGTLLGVSTLALFSRMGESQYGLAMVINIAAVVTMLSGVAVWFLFDDADTGESAGAALAGVWEAMRTPRVWVIGMIIFCAFGLFAGQSYTTPYMTQMFGASASFGALIGLIRTYGLQTIGGPGGGMIADRIGSPAKVIAGAFALSIASLVLFLVIPVRASALVWVTATVVSMGLAVFALRGTFYATIEEARLPRHNTGAIVGLAAFIGYLPDAFTYPLVGYWLDTYPGLPGYRITFAYMLCLGVLGFGLALWLLRMNRQAGHDSPSG